MALPYRPKSPAPSHHQSPNRYDTLPDLRFLNHNNPPPTATSLLDPMSKNGMAVQQVVALKEAEAWYMATATLLGERLALCERLKEGLKELNGLLERIQEMRRNESGDDDNSGGEGKRTSGEEGVVMGGAAHVEDLECGVGAVENGCGSADAVRGGGGTDASSSDVDLDGRVDDNLKAMEAAVESWLKDIRVSRAKWIAGGTNMEKRIGLR